MIKLRGYQERIATGAASKLRQYGCCYLSMECRTGKTITALSAADRFGAKSVLFVTKLKAIPSIQADYGSLRPIYSMDVTNYESAHKVTGKYDLVILDEAHSLGAYPKPSKRTVNLKEICKGLPVLYLSGTPSPESYSQLYHQFWVCDFSPWKKYKTFYKWARAGYVHVHQRKLNGYLINDYSEANKQMIDADILHLFISYSQEQAGFSTDIIEHVVTVPMEPQTRMLIDTLQRDKVVSIYGETILGASPATLLTKMHQLSSGTIICENGTVFAFDESKAKYIKQHFKGKIAVFYVYQQEFELLKRTFPNWTDSPEEFQSASDKVFISQVRRAREGVRLDSADALIFFNLEYSYLSYEQGRNRLVSKERSTPADVYFLVSDCGIERDILDAVHGKMDFTLSYFYKTKRNERKAT